MSEHIIALTHSHPLLWLLYWPHYMGIFLFQVRSC